MICFEEKEIDMRDYVIKEEKMAINQYGFVCGKWLLQTPNYIIYQHCITCSAYNHSMAPYKHGPNCSIATTI